MPELVYRSLRFDKKTKPIRAEVVRGADAEAVMRALYDLTMAEISILKPEERSSTQLTFDKWWEVCQILQKDYYGYELSDYRNSGVLEDYLQHLV
ncbi:MAG: hypothetical protein HGA90_05935, partial [Alphaproteobacteria bacterium]|nr:hypothetical protein [Alphaproteobacteria bacterium]